MLKEIATLLREIAGLLASAKGAAAAAVIAGSAVTGTVAAVPEVREAVTESASAVTTTLGSAVAAVAQAANERRAADTSCGKPEQVAQRNEANKQLRDAFHDGHKTLTGLKGGKDTDHQKVNALVKVAQEDLRARLTVALVDVARQTQGRTGQVAKANAGPADLTASTSTSPKPSASPSTSTTLSEAQQTTSTGDATACDESGGKQDVELNAILAAIVEEAVDDMADIVEKAGTDAGAVLPAERGKPSNDPARSNDKKPADAQKGQPADKPGNKPSTPPGRTR